MGKKSSPSPPQPANPFEVGMADAAFNRGNQFTPYGNLYYTPPTFEYDKNGNPVGVLEPSSSYVDLPPEMQNLLDSRFNLDQGMLDAAQGYLGGLNDLPGLPTGLDYGALPDAPSAFQPGQVPTADYSGISVGGQNFAGLGTPTADYSGLSAAGIDLSGTRDLTPYTQNRQRVEQATFDRMKGLLDPVFSEQEDKLRQTFANRGLRAGGEGFNSEMTKFRDDRNEAFQDAALQAVLAGGGEQTREFALRQGANQDALQRALAQYGSDRNASEFGADMIGRQFGADLAGSGFDLSKLQAQASQDLGLGQFAQSLIGSQYGADQSAYSQYGQAQAQQYGQQQALRDQAIREQLQNMGIAQNVRGTGFNEMASLLGLQQIANPGLQNFFQPGQTDMTGAFALNQQGQNANYAAQMQQQGGLMSGLFGLGSGLFQGAGAAGGFGALFSDIRLKTNIRKVGDEYEWEWNEEAKRIGADKYPTRGEIAQEVLLTEPHRVSVGPHGYLMVSK